jgi:nitrogen fixation NifU-like protein
MSAADYRKLYKDVILKLSKDPHNFRKDENANIRIKASNPLCGDQFEIYLTLDGGKIGSAGFHGYGCAISKASTSILVQTLEGQRLDDVSSICQRFIDALDTDPTEGSLPREWQAFQGVRDYPGRRQCAVLGWETVVEYEV